MAKNRAEVKQSTEVDAEEIEIAFDCFSEMFPDDIARKAAQYVADLLSSDRGTAHRFNVEFVNEFDQTMEVRESRNSIGEYKSRVSVSGIEAGTITQARHKQTLVRTSIWRNGRSRVDWTLSIEFLPAGVLRSWAFGETEVADDATTTLRTILQETVDESNGDNSIYFPVSKQSIDWEPRRREEILNRMALEVGALLGRPIAIHPHWGVGSSSPAVRSRKKSKSPKQSTERQFSGAGTGDFSLRDQMGAVGVDSIDDLYRRTSAGRIEAAELRRLVRSIAGIRSDDDLGRVLARMMFACSKVETVSDSQGAARLKAQLDIGGIEGPQDVAVSRFAVTAVLAGIDEARRSGLGGRCVTALQSIAPIWCNDLPAGEDRLGGTNGRQWVTAAVIVYLAELTASSELAADMIAESLMGGTAVGKREQVRLAWAYGRSWAEANGIDFDDYVRRSM